MVWTVAQSAQASHFSSFKSGRLPNVVRDVGWVTRPCSECCSGFGTVFVNFSGCCDKIVQQHHVKGKEAYFISQFKEQSLMDGTLRQQELEAGGYCVPNQKRQMDV